LDMARQFEQAGIKRLHLVDLDGAKAKKIVNKEVLRSIAQNTSLKVDFGGGVQSDQDIELAFEYGASQVTGGSIAVRNPQLFEKWLLDYGSEKIILGGWEETTTADVISFIRTYVEKGIRYVICTDVAKDGLLQGPSLELYKDILQEIPQVRLIASGGVSSLKDLEDLQQCGVYGVIVGKAFYEGRISLEELAAFV
jgi:phosphoribosylformimino-5-aminoimidazole carboxamide ribotide isomerase